MNDYISKQAAVDELNHLMDIDGFRDGYAVSRSSVEHMLKHLPSTDAVEVVRCRDCKHRYIDGENVRYNVCDLNHNKVQGDDWYCADAERRTDDKTNKGSSC